MALQKDFYNRLTDATIPNCYWKIASDEGISGSKNMIYVKMLCYENREHADTNSDELTQFDFEFIPNLGAGFDFFAQGYEFIKESDFFENAIDI